MENTETRELTAPAGARRPETEARFLALLITVVAVGLIFGAMVRMQPISGSNDGSRWNTVWSLTNGKGYIIDDAPYPGVDKVRREGHFYSSKPALLPTLLAGPAWLIRSVAGWSIPAESHIVIRLILTFTNILPFAVFLLLFDRLAERYSPALPVRLFALCSAAFGTYLTAYSITLNNHTQGAIAAFLAIYCLVRILYDGQTAWYYFALCGLFCAWTVVSEMVAVAFAVPVMLLLFRRQPRRTLQFFVPLATILAAAYFYTTWLSSGSLIPYYVRFHSEVYHYEGSYWNNPRGIDAANEPKWFYALNLLIGHHGIFSLSPVFLIGFYGMWNDRKLRAVHVLGMALTAVMFVFYTFKTNNYGGVAQGARWLFWLIPFWLLGLVPALQERMASRRFRALALAALLVSVLAVGHAMSGNKDQGRPGPWSSSWIQILMHNRGWIAY